MIKVSVHTEKQIDGPILDEVEWALMSSNTSMAKISFNPSDEYQKGNAMSKMSLGMIDTDEKDLVLDRIVDICYNNGISIEDLAEGLTVATMLNKEKKESRYLLLPLDED